MLVDLNRSHIHELKKILNISQNSEYTDHIVCKYKQFV